MTVAENVALAGLRGSAPPGEARVGRCSTTHIAPLRADARDALGRRGAARALARALVVAPTCCCSTSPSPASTRPRGGTPAQLARSSARPGDDGPCLPRPGRGPALADAWRVLMRGRILQLDETARRVPPPRVGGVARLSASRRRDAAPHPHGGDHGGGGRGRKLEVAAPGRRGAGEARIRPRTDAHAAHGARALSSRAITSRARSGSWSRGTRDRSWGRGLPSLRQVTARSPPTRLAKGCRSPRFSRRARPPHGPAGGAGDSGRAFA